MFFFSTWSPDLKGINYVDPDSVYRKTWVCMYTPCAQKHFRGVPVPKQQLPVQLWFVLLRFSVSLLCLIMGFLLSVKTLSLFFSCVLVEAYSQDLWICDHGIMGLVDWVCVLGAEFHLSGE